MKSKNKGKDKIVKFKGSEKFRHVQFENDWRQLFGENWNFIGWFNLFRISYEVFLVHRVSIIVLGFGVSFRWKGKNGL